jgi:tyrosyl-tRNA synthetase|tara:strand:- start:1248 stop:2528 length:1281 start_codon:yes stop_codon:yes gene_type:complete
MDMVKMSPKDIEKLLQRGVADVIVREELVELLGSGKKLRLKEGFDPSFPDIHLGHMVALKKLRKFQELGHQVILIVGDWTAQIGDPSGASITRPMLSAQQVKANAETYLQQFFKIVDETQTEVRWQSEWFGKFTLADVIQLTSKFTIAQLLQRDDFSKRYSAGQPITMTEFLYPLLQAYDSVAIQSDIEFGGTDQEFNLLVGRKLQSMVGQRPQQLLLVPILTGTDGSQKMSKSLGNYIGVAEPPEEIYGKVMSIPDNIILDYFKLVTDISNQELDEFKQELENETVNPMELKKRLAREIVSQLYDRKAASEADEEFKKVVQKKEMPKEIPEYRVSFDQFKAVELSRSGRKESYTINRINISRLLVSMNLAKSRSEADRLIYQGAVSIDSKVIPNNTMLDYNIKSGSVIKVGKRRFAKVINSDILK